MIRGLVLIGTVIATLSPDTSAAAQGQRLVQETAPRKLEVVWKAGGGNDAATSFADITSIAVSPTTGNVVVWDRRTPALRMYDPNGELVRNIGRRGSGPGEWTQVNGLAFVRDGRLLEWDAGNSRVNIYKQNGDFETSWVAPLSGTITPNGFTIDSQNRAYLRVLQRPDRSSFSHSWLRVDALTGKLIDTVFAPQPEGTDAPLTVRDANGVMSRNLPYGRVAIAALNTNGDVMWGSGAEYVINTVYNGKPLQIKRAHTPVPVPNAERAELRASTEWAMKRRQPEWSWTGRDVPNVKPPYAGFASGMDGRIWVVVNGESEKFTPEKPERDPADRPPPDTFRDKSRRWDVFEPDGRFIATVVGARNVLLGAAQGNYAWGIMTDDDDVPVLVKFRITPGP